MAYLCEILSDLCVLETFQRKEREGIRKGSKAEDVLKRSSTEPHTKIKRLRIYTDKPEQFEVKKKYLFTVKVKGAVPPGRPITDVELVSFEPAKK